MVKNIEKTIVQPLAAFMVGTYDENDIPDVMNAAWASQCGPKHVTINFAPNRKTLENINLNKEFTVAYATRETLEIADYFGLASASKTPDKVEKTGVKIQKSENINAPIVLDFPITLECKLIDLQEIVPNRITVTGEIINTVAADDIVDDDGNVDTESIEFIAYDGNTRNYRVLGEVAGKAFNPDNLL